MSVSQTVCVCVCLPPLPLPYLGEASLAVGDVGPVFAVQAVRQLVLPDEGPVLGAGAALQPPSTLGNNASHHLGHAQVRLPRTQTQWPLLAHNEPSENPPLLNKSICAGTL